MKLAPAFLIAWFALLVMPRPWATAILAENGPVELPSAVAYFVAAMFLWFASERRRWHSEGAAVLLLLAGGLRELDFQARFTSSYAFSSGYFLRSPAPIWEKAIVSVILIGLALCAVALLIRNGRPFLEALRSTQPWAMSTAAAIGFMFVSTGLDGAGGFLRRNYATAVNAQFAMWVIEETLEAAIPVLFAIAVLQSARSAASIRRRRAA